MFSGHYIMSRGIDKLCPRTKTKRPSSVPYTEDQLKQLIKRFDTNKDGRLSKKELENAFNSLGAFAPKWRAFRALQRADADGNGYVSEDELDELIKYILKYNYSSIN